MGDSGQFQLFGVRVVEPVARVARLGCELSSASYSDAVGRFPLPTAMREKARQLCRALQQQIHDLWWAAVDVDTHLCRPSGMHAERLAVMAATGAAVTTVQAIYEVFLRAYPRQPGQGVTSSTWESACHGDPLGRAASGLKLIRNGEMHSTVTVVPEIVRVVGVPFDDGSEGFRLFPSWAAYDALPVEITEARRPPKKGQSAGDLATNKVHHDHYREACAGRPGVEPLLDALAFFKQCDPGVPSLVGDGELRYFPLTPLAQLEYERRHPDWPSRTQVEAEVRSDSRSHRPHGTRRVCSGHFEDPSGRVIAHYGYTEHSGSRWSAFTESDEQVRKDVSDHGFPYWVEWDGRAFQLMPDDNGDLRADPSTAITHVSRTTGDEPWVDWYALCERDAFYYARQRQP